METLRDGGGIAAGDITIRVHSKGVFDERIELQMQQLCRGDIHCRKKIYAKLRWLMRFNSDAHSHWSVDCPILQLNLLLDFNPMGCDESHLHVVHSVEPLSVAASRHFADS
jgi:hypothetical protein